MELNRTEKNLKRFNFHKKEFKGIVVNRKDFHFKELKKIKKNSKRLHCNLNEFKKNLGELKTSKIFE